MDDTLLKQARQLNLRNGGKACRLPPIILMTDDRRLPDPEPAIRALPIGSMVIFRHYDHTDRTRLAMQFHALCRQRSLVFLVADDLHLALRLGADGIHLPEYHIGKNPGIYARIPVDMLVTSACHGHETLRRLCLLPERFRPDGVLISPVFPTASHPGAPTIGPDRFSTMAHICLNHGMAAIGLGGINAKNVGKLRASPIASLAGIGFSVA